MSFLEKGCCSEYVAKLSGREALRAPASTYFLAIAGALRVTPKAVGTAARVIASKHAARGMTTQGDSYFWWITLLFLADCRKTRAVWRAGARGQNGCWCGAR